MRFYSVILQQNFYFYFKHDLRPNNSLVWPQISSAKLWCIFILKTGGYYSTIYCILRKPTSSHVAFLRVLFLKTNYGCWLVGLYNGTTRVLCVAGAGSLYIQDDTKKRELLKNPTKIEEIQEKKFTDRN